MLKPRYTLIDLDNQLITQPNQAFTPRQILEQFARNEIIPSMNEPSDNIYDDGTNEDALVHDVIEFEDQIDAENHLIENQYRLYQDEQRTETPPATPAGDQEPPAAASE